jgi:hypothetical protein
VGAGQRSGQGHEGPALLSGEVQPHGQALGGAALGMHLVPLQVLDAARAQPGPLRQHLLGQTRRQPVAPQQRAKAPALLLVGHLSCS